jgi:purine-nucleoside phosphorylase
MSSTSPAPGDPASAAATAAAAIAARTGVARHDVALVLGSGWRPAADLVGEIVAEVPIADIPGLSPPSVAGHGGTIRSLRVTGGTSAGAQARTVLAFLGRTHFYEGHGVAATVAGVRAAVAAGCGTVVLTNGCGGVNPAFHVGQPVLISDHINLTATSPLVGATFVDLTDLYSPRLRGLAREVDPTLAEGVYAQLPGPHYETPAEIRYLRTIGADLVGMSTALEAIAARAAGAEVLGFSLVTNAAAGMTGEALNHEEVLEAGRDAAERMGGLLAEVVRRL